MFLSLFRYIQGYLKIRVVGYSPERFLNLCKNKKIDIWGLESVHNAYEMYIKITGFRKLKPILRKTRTKVMIEERIGLPFFFYKYRKRNLFFAGIFLCFILVYGLTFFVWNIDVQGNQRITDEVIIEYLETKQVSHGMAKHKINCEQIVKDIRKKFDEIIWVSVSVEGTRLFVHVKENTDTFSELDEQENPCDIIADRDGIVVRIVTRSGVPKVQAGSEVRAGDVLVSGTVDVMNDAQEVIAQHAVAADADIAMETTRQYEKVIERKYREKQYTKRKRTISYLKIGNYTIHFGFSKVAYDNYDRFTKEVQLRVGENFYLPIFVGQKRFAEYKWKTLEYSEEELEKLLNESFKQYCKELKDKNAVILEKELFITQEDTRAVSKATISLQEEVGVRRKNIAF